MLPVPLPLHLLKRSRAERISTSCSECRRRKQKCNKGHPCSNCARRFPPPSCEYKENRHKDEPIPNPSTFVPLQPLPDLIPAWAKYHENAGGLVVWSGVDVVIQFPGSATSGKPNAHWGTINHSSLPDCEPGCTTHSESLHEAVTLFQYTNNILNRYIMSWDANITHVDFDWNEAVGASSNLHALASPLELLHTLPLEPTPLNSELLQIYVKVISRFKSSLDGDPDFNAPFHKYYLPFCLQSPLLARVSIYTAACLLSETNHLDKTITMWIKGSAIRLLNDLLRSERFATGDEAIAGVAQLIADEWYWGDTHDLRAHLEGMRQMIKLRGGFRNLGLNGLLSKMVIMTDFCIAITFEEPPYLHNGAEFEFSDTNPGPFKIAHNTPLLPSIDTFASCADAYKLHPTTASILDDIRFLIATIVALQKDVSSQENKKLRSTAQWIHGRIAALPPDSPESTRSSSSSTPDLSASSNTSQNSTQSTQQARSDFQPNSFDKPPYCPQPDYLYQSIRLAALIYTSAIIARKPFSESCSLQKLYELWKTVWRVPLATWKSMLGIFLWIEVAITPPARDTPHGRFVKSMLSVAGLNLGIENWHASSNALRGAMRLQAWLNEGRE